MAGTLTVDGRISADPTPRSTGGKPGQGSGGSIWLDAGMLTGGGVIRAAGAADNSGGGSGGGRIAIACGSLRGGFAGLRPLSGLYTNREDLAANVTVRGGGNTGANGPEDGSLYIFRRLGGTVVFLR